MKNTLIATLGFDERHVVRSILQMGVEKIDKIILLTPSWDHDERTVSAIQEIGRIAGLAGIPGGIHIERIRVEDFFTSVSQIIKTIHEEYLSGRKGVILSLGGGLRILVLEAYTAAIIYHNMNKDMDITVRVEIEGKNKHIQYNINTVPFIINIRENEKKVLEALYEKPETLSELARRLGIPKATLWKQLSKMQQKGLVTRENTAYKITELGKTTLLLTRYISI